MLLKTPNRRSVGGKLLKSLAIIFVTLILAFLLVFSTICSFRKDSKSYSIKFYDKDNLIEVVELEDGQTISPYLLESINSKINTYDGLYFIEWSYRKNELIKVDFNELKTNASVYLFKLKNEYTVNIDESDKYNAKIKHDGPIKYGSRVTVDIDPLVDTTKYHVEVSINGIVQTNNEDYTYDINITNDVVVNVAVKEIVEIIPNKDCKLVYNNIPLFAGYSLVTKEEKLVEATDVSVKYTDESGNTTLFMKDAGKYTVTMEYVGDTYYCNDIVQFEVEVLKATPTIELNNNNFYYNGSSQSIEVNDISTNSDGNINIKNNSFKYPGIYKVEVDIEESKNYLPITKEFEIIVNKGLTTITKYPDISLGFEHNPLSSVNISNGSANVDGTFKWTESAILTPGVRCSIIEFIPNDECYEIVIFNMDVEVISSDESLRRIKIDRNNLYNEYKDILNNYVYGLSDLPVIGDTYNSNITWLSNSTSLKVDRFGNINLLDNVSNKDVTLTAYITLGNAAEYATFEFTLFFEEEISIVNQEVAQIEEVTYIPTIDEIIELVTINKEFINVQEFSILDKVIISSPKEIIVNQIIKLYEYDDNNLVSNVQNIIKEEQTSSYIYKSRCNKKRSISEIILWKIISDSAGANGPNDVGTNSLFRNIIYELIPDKDIGINKDIGQDNDIGTIKIDKKQKDIIINFMKGEK